MNERIITGPAPGSTANTTITTGPAPGSDIRTSASHATTADRTTYGELHVAAVFSDHMVLQRDRQIPVFGTAPTGATVRVELLAANGDIVRGEDVTVGCADCGTDDAAAISSEDRWLVELPAMSAGGPYTLQVSLTMVSRETLHGTAPRTITFADVHIGEVWLAGGQSNMELELRNSNHADEAVAASGDPLLRFYNTPKTGVIDPALEAQSGWCACTPATSGTMSAVAYYFARRLRAELGPGVPVGIIDCYIGGTSITAWMSRRTLETCAAGRGYLERFQSAIAGKTDEQFAAETHAWQTRFDTWNAQIGAARTAEPDITWDTLNARYGECPWPPPVTPTSQYRPTGPYGTMIERVAPYGLAGFLWYQGEEDEVHCDSYRELLGLMIDEWRGLWNAGHCNAGRHDTSHCNTGPTGIRTTGTQPGDIRSREIAPLPFLIVQLPQWIDKNTAAAHADPLHWPVIREAQWDAMRTIANVFTITTIDCGEFDNIHPTDKRTPGERLADCALRNVYGLDDIATDGPELADVEFTNRVFPNAGRTVGGAKAGSATTDSMPADDTTVGNTTVNGATADGTVAVVTLRFDHANGLRFDGTTPGTRGSAGNDPVYRNATESGFELAGVDGVWHDVDAMVHGGTVMLRSGAVNDPVAVRYAWRSWGPAPLFNSRDLPAPPFRLALR
ncbi:sialate O-acetylesterase [Bifidobacterium amazonense]|uniref:Sialate O-acetylesterase n=1 Tax=Bifidobacterium amazonense TaxID=2809027 RepID=A0ABS9VV46_9BIFI|nr:sialate O-acetylesterase [Bifidobacterium amazonense]MCH9275964.1 sialate O-acetylesterase [Bifidobacterium amazonense]